MNFARPLFTMYSISGGARRQLTGMHTAPILFAPSTRATQSAVCLVRQETRSPGPMPRLAKPCATRRARSSSCAKVQTPPGVRREGWLEVRGLFHPESLHAERFRDPCIFERGNDHREVALLETRLLPR